MNDDLTRACLSVGNLAGEHERLREKSEAQNALLNRADDMLRRADVMLDGWQQARDWCNDLIKLNTS